MVFSVGSHVFDVDAKFVPDDAELQEMGSFGIVCCATDIETGDRVAVKRVCNLHEDLNDARRFVREIYLLRHLSHENVMSVKDVVTTAEPLEELYVVVDFMDTDLHSIISSSQPLIEDHIQFFTYQILRGLKYIHSANVLHRELKPFNLLVNRNCDLKICHFGLPGPLDDLSHPKLHICDPTRWYRAPEVFYSTEHTCAIDMWSVGCILAEMLGREPLFKGKNYRDQLALILKLLGRLTEEDLHAIRNEKVREYLSTLGSPTRTPFSDVFPAADPLALDLLERMLQFDPRKRITAAQALEHPYLAAYHAPEDEPVAEKPFEFDLKKVPPDRQKLHDMLREVMFSIRPERDGAAT